jgi:hypothetical protein
LAATALIAGLSAQQNTFTSPKGYESIEGGTVATSLQPLAQAFWGSRWQYIDAGQRGPSPRTISKLEMRRDGLQYLWHVMPTSVNLGVLMAHTDAQALSTTFASNYKTAPVVVLPPTSVGLPGLSSSPPIQPPAPFTIAFPFAQPFVFDGAHDLLWEFVVLLPQSATGYPVDAVVGGTGGGSGSVVSPPGGCQTPNGTFALTGAIPQTSGAGLTTLGFYAAGGPGNASTWLALGLSNPALDGLFCAQVGTSAEVAVPYATNALGQLGTAANLLTVAFGFPGPITIHGQLLALDAAQPLLGVDLSNCTRWTLSTYTPAAPVWVLYDSSNFGADTGTWSRAAIPVVRWTYY